MNRYVFDYREEDTYACVADCGWITGHSYIVYGPLANGATTLMFESTPTYPHKGRCVILVMFFFYVFTRMPIHAFTLYRYWEMIQTHKINQLYTAPTAIRALMKLGIEPLEGYDLSSLRVLGTVGEPINPEAWRWYYKNVGKEQCAIVDTFWQTET